MQSVFSVFRRPLSWAVFLAAMIVSLIALGATFATFAPFAYAASTRSATFKLEGRLGSFVSLYRIPPGAKDTERARFIPVAPARVGEEIFLEPGRYFASNACSGYAFEQKNEPMVLALSTLRFAPHREVLPEDPSPVDGTRHLVHVSCVDPVEGETMAWNNLLELSFLPGAHRVLLAGSPVDVSFGGRGTERVIELYPLTVSLQGEAGGTRYFVLPEEQATRADATLVPVPVGGTIWVTPGVYGLEINGSRRRAAVQAGMRTRVTLGVLRIESPAKFPTELRARLGGQPVFAYINGGVLLNLNKDYVVFPGDYAVSIEGSEIQEVFPVVAGETTRVKTLGALIEAPVCPAGSSCRNVPVITIHKEQRPYSLMNVMPGMPFLVLDGKYEYGVEGMRGVLRQLATESEGVATEKLGRLRFKWEVRQASSRTRTDLVRLEARGLPENFGRSLDLLFSKPDEVYLPAGSYFLTYFVGDPQQERSKTRVEFNLQQGHTFEITVPIFTDKLPPKPEEKNARASGNGGANGTPANGKPEPLPSSLVPIRK